MISFVIGGELGRGLFLAPYSRGFLIYVVIREYLKAVCHLYFLSVAKIAVC